MEEKELTYFGLAVKKLFKTEKEYNKFMEEFTQFAFEEELRNTDISLLIRTTNAIKICLNDLDKRLKTLEKKK
jgi:undecaprenyl pyrophosphate synthase